MDGECQKKAVYHHDDLAPYGFGTQYNHFMIFYAVASLSERIPQEEGPWTLGCKSESIHEGFSTCWLNVKEQWPKCPLEKNNKYRTLWSKRNRQHENHYEQNMVLDAASEEWHFDAWPLRYLLLHLAVPCGQTTLRITLHHCCLLRRVAARGSYFRHRRSRELSAKPRVTPRSGTLTWCATWQPGWRQLTEWTSRAPDAETFGMGRRPWLFMSGAQTSTYTRTGAYSLNEYLGAARKQGWMFHVVFIATDDPDAVLAKAAHLKQQEGLDYVTFPRENDEWENRHSHQGTRALLDEIACLAEADYFIGSAKSNIPWLVQTIRTQPVDTALDVSGGALTFF